MMFRNATMFRFPLSVSHAFEDAERNDGASFEITPPWALKALEECALKPVGPLELSSRGFIAPYGDHGTQLAVTHGDCVWLTVGSEDKILPPSVVNKALAEKLADIERAQGRKPGGRARKRIKEDVVHELLPRALVRSRRTDAYLDLKRGVVFVDTASRKSAEAVVSEIRGALASFPAIPLNAELAPRAVMTAWVAGEPTPDHLLGDDCATLKDACDGSASVKLKHVDMASEEVAKHLEAGKQVSRLSMIYEPGIEFSIDEDLVLRKLSYGDVLIDQLEAAGDREDVCAELDARFVLMTGALGGLFDVLEGALKISRAEG